jgi:hypothetical protein
MWRSNQGAYAGRPGSCRCAETTPPRPSTTCCDRRTIPPTHGAMTRSGSPVTSSSTESELAASAQPGADDRRVRRVLATVCRRPCLSRQRCPGRQPHRVRPDGIRTDRPSTQDRRDHPAHRAGVRVGDRVGDLRAHPRRLAVEARIGALPDPESAWPELSRQSRRFEERARRPRVRYARQPPERVRSPHLWSSLAYYAGAVRRLPTWCGRQSTQRWRTRAVRATHS